MSKPKTLRRLEDLTLDPTNANVGTVRGTQLLDRSLEDHGAGRGVVVDKYGLVIAGNKTVELAVARGLGLKTIPSDGTTLVVVQRTDLDLAEPPARLLAYLDNRTAEVGLQWNPTQMAADLAAGLSLDGLFTEQELAHLLATDPPESFELAFDSAMQRRQWDALVQWLAIRFPTRTPADRLDQWVTERLEALGPDDGTDRPVAPAMVTPGREFETVDERIATAYTCRHCTYEWSGTAEVCPKCGHDREP